jgi:hypothetical protein
MRPLLTLLLILAACAPFFIRFLYRLDKARSKHINQA